MSSEVRITFEFSGNPEKYVLPVLPPQIQIHTPSGNESTEVVKLGEITILKRKKLRSFTIDAFFPSTANAYSFCVTNDNFKPPSYYLSAFETAMERKIPAKITIENVGLKSFWVSIENFTTTFGRTSDIEYSIELKEFRPYGQLTKTIDKTETLFGIQSEKILDSTGKKRQSNGFAIGDKVIVSGPYFENPDGRFQALQPPLNYLKEPFNAALETLWGARNDYFPGKLDAQRCIICNKAEGKLITFDVPFAADQDVTIPQKYNIQVADLEKRTVIGWVQESQITRIE